MFSLHHNGLYGILADEMGLGKTLQTISSPITPSALPRHPRPTPQRRPKINSPKLGSRVQKLDARRQMCRHGLEGRRLQDDPKPAHHQRLRRLCRLVRDLPYREGRHEEVLFPVHRDRRGKNVDPTPAHTAHACTSRGRLLITGDAAAEQLEGAFRVAQFHLSGDLLGFGQFLAQGRHCGEMGRRREQGGCRGIA